jgi:hypothetical protein
VFSSVGSSTSLCKATYFTKGKNYLFAGSNCGGERTATIYSLFGIVRLNCINPERYLRYVLTHIAEHPINRIAELLP